MSCLPLAGFNEAAGFTQRKRSGLTIKSHSDLLASMRPPVLPSGNTCIRMAESASGTSLQ